MATKFNVSLDASFRDKFQIFDSDENLIAHVPTNLATDFFNIFLGWLVNLPQKFQFTLEGQLVTVINRFKILGASSDINIAEQEVAHVTRQRRNQPPFTVQLADQQYNVTVTTNNNYFAVDDGDHKLLVAKRGTHNLERYSVVLADDVDAATGLGITIAILSAIKH